MSEQRALSVSEAMNAAKRTLETLAFRVVGEVSEFSDKPGYKAAYFTICDQQASMSCMMWVDAYRASGVKLRCGMLVELSGTFSAYVPKGRMQFMVRSMSIAGEGMLRLQVAELARRLESEGLMRPELRRPLPSFPVRIGVVTSPRGKAVHDVIRTLRRRYPLAELMIAGVPVEGADAPRFIVQGLEAARKASCDVILLVRGGGSYEDLMPFNHESVARAVASSDVPVVTGIGHEPDTSIADMVADLRASTPTAAAEAAAPSVAELQETLIGRRRMLGRALAHRIQIAAHRLNLLSQRPVLHDPNALFAPYFQRLDVDRLALHRAIPGRFERDGQRLSYLREKLERIGPQAHARAAEKVARSAARLHDLSPLAILGRGYAVCFLADGAGIVRSTEDVREGDSISVRISDGTLGCVVQSTDGK
ncbi:MAG: exodeoxyribonuclease VII large subunit [Coriobacteriia bacterium]|nr:exodeoxyribonuclease VII large subunit [Coriobacteriia bacterium]